MGTDSNEKNGIFEQYAHLQLHEHHFNNIELEIRKIASGWLIVALGAIAFIVRGAYLSEAGDSHLMGNPNSLIIIICCMANLGIYLLWQLDQMAYHKLLDGVFKLGLQMEKDHNELPKMRTWMENSANGITKYIRWYYLSPMLVFAIIAFVFIISVIVNNKPEILYDYELPILLGIITIYISGKSLYQNKKTKKNKIRELSIITNNKTQTD